MSTGTRVSVSTNVSETIRNIMEITVNHSEEEVYAMLKECNMDPNETIQRLIHQGMFHEVRRKRDKKKEIPSNKEPVDVRPRPAPFERINRANRVNYSARNSSQGTCAVTNAISKPAVIKDKETLLVSIPTAVHRTASTAHGRGKLHGSHSEQGDGSPKEQVDSPAVNTHKRAHVSSKGKAACFFLPDPVPIPSSSQPIGPQKGSSGSNDNAVVSVVKSLSSFNIHSQLTGPPKGMEWKPKPIPLSVPAPTPVEIPTPIPAETPVAVPVVIASNPPVVNGVNTVNEDVVAPTAPPKKQHVIIPNHIHVPESERNKLSFGSIDTWFGENATGPCAAVRERTPAPSELNDPSIIQHSGEVTSSVMTELLSLSPSSSVVSSSSSGGDVDAQPVQAEQPKREDPSSAAATGVISGHHLQNSGGYVHGNPMAVELQARGDVAGRLPGFLVPQQFDASGYYGAQVDGRVSPFAPPKFNAAVQEGGSQPFPIFRQPAGMHMTAGMHYPPPPPPPPNYIHYIAPPFYVSPTAIHQILTSNTAAAANFSHHHQQQQQQQQQQYPQPMPALKYPLPPYKPGVLPPLGSYIPYGTGPTSSAVNDDLSVQYNAQQNEGPGMWVAAPVRDMSGMQGAPFYGLPPQPGYVPVGTQPVTAVVHPLLQQAQSMGSAGGLVSGDVTGGAMFQHVPASWANGY